MCYTRRCSQHPYPGWTEAKGEHVAQKFLIVKRRRFSVVPLGKVEFWEDCVIQPGIVIHWDGNLRNEKIGTASKGTEMEEVEHHLGKQCLFDAPDRFDAGRFLNLK